MPDRELPVVLGAFAANLAEPGGRLRNVSLEHQSVQDVFSRVKLCDWQGLPAANVDNIFDAFAAFENRIYVFHFAGHASGYALLLEKARDGGHTAHGTGLADAFANQHQLKLIFLNGCATKGHIDMLREAGVSAAVIATSRSIDDEVGLLFSRQFYTWLSKGASIQNSFDQAKAYIRTKEGFDPKNHRALYFGKIIEHPLGDHDAPWILAGSDEALQWRLDDAAADPWLNTPPASPQSQQQFDRWRDSAWLPRFTRELRDLMLECDALQSVDVRDSVIEMLPPAIGASVPRLRDSASGDLLNILCACLRHTDGIHELRAAMELTNIHPEDRDGIIDAIDMFQTIEQVRPLLRQVKITSATRKQVFNEVMGAPVDDPPDSLDDTLYFLLGQYLSRTQFYEFLYRLGRTSGTKAIEDWVRDNAPSAELLEDIRQKLTDEAAAEAPTYYLSFDLGTIERDERFTYWLYRGAKSLVHKDIVPCQLSEVVADTAPRAIEEVYQKVRLMTQNGRELVVELFVPTKLLCCQADRWPLKESPLDEYPPPLGVRHPVVLRWADRVRGAQDVGQLEQATQTWRKVTDAVRKLVAVNDGHPLLSWCSDKYHPSQLVAIVNKGSYGACLGFEFVPAADQAAKSLLLVGAALRGGLPYGFWLRQEPTNWEKAKGSVNGLLKELDLSRFPERVRDFRYDQFEIEPGQPSDEIADRLAVFWDDPDRNPLLGHWTPP